MLWLVIIGGLLFLLWSGVTQKKERLNFDNKFIKNKSAVLFRDISPRNRAIEYIYGLNYGPSGFTGKTGYAGETGYVGGETGYVGETGKGIIKKCLN